MLRFHLIYIMIFHGSDSFFGYILPVLIVWYQFKVLIVTYETIFKFIQSLTIENIKSWSLMTSFSSHFWNAASISLACLDFWTASFLPKNKLSPTNYHIGIWNQISFGQWYHWCIRSYFSFCCWCHISYDTYLILERIVNVPTVPNNPPSVTVSTGSLLKVVLFQGEL